MYISKGDKVTANDDSDGKYRQNYAETFGKSFKVYGNRDIDDILKFSVKENLFPFKINYFDQSLFPFVFILQEDPTQLEERYVLSLKPLTPLETTRYYPPKAKVVLNYVKTLRVYVKNNNAEFIDFIEEDPLKSHFKKKASQKKRASPKAKKASPKAKKASPKAKKASPKAKKASPKAKKSSR